MNLPLIKALIRIKEAESILEANKRRGMEVCGEVPENGAALHKLATNRGYSARFVAANRRSPGEN
jgi:hypothetical protein